MPFLPGRAYIIDGPEAGRITPPRQRATLNEWAVPFAVAIPAAGAALAAAGLLVSVFTRHFGAVALLAAYPAAILSGVLLVLGALLLRVQQAEIRLNESCPQRNVPPIRATVTGTLGTDISFGVGAAGAAASLFIAAVAMIHRTLWARLVFLTLATLALALGALLVFLVEPELP
jgi:hypothetical protein